MSTPLPPEGAHHARRKRSGDDGDFWAALPLVVPIAIGVIGIAIEIAGWGTEEGTHGGSGTEASSCRQPAPAWLATLQSAFYEQYRDAEMTPLGYVEEDTSEGKAYYVAVRVEGVDGVAVFGTFKPPLQSGPGLIFAGNSAASQLSDLGADISEDSSVRSRYTRWITQWCTASRR